MPNDLGVWAVPVGTTYKSDSRIRNAKLSEKSLSYRLRDRKLMLPSDSPFQNRTLNKFPMEYNRTESKRNADYQHITRKYSEDKIRKAKKDSENLRQYSLKMFDSVVEVHTGMADNRQALSELPTRIQSAHNGPTHNGSVLYNKRSSVLNSIRLRPKSEPPGRFNHLKSQTIQPQIKQTLCRSNKDYTVSCVSTPVLQSARSVSTLSNRSDFVLIPNGSICTEEIDNGTSDVTDSVFDENEIRSNASTCISMDPSFLRRNLPSAKIHFYSIEEDSGSDEEVDVPKSPEVPPTEEVKKDVLPEPQKEPARPKSGKGRPKSGKAKRSASPKSKTKRGKSPKGKKSKDKEPVPVTPPPVEVKVIETPPPPKPLKGPKCWVDDATITSEKEIFNDEAMSQTSKPGSPTNKAQTKTNMKTEICETEKIPTLPEPPKKEVETMVLEEVEQFVPSWLPPFICPSSEERSRQEAIKDWLTNSHFDFANRSVPLL